MARKAIRFLSSPTAHALAITAALLSLFLAGYLLYAQSVLTNCLADYNEKSSLAAAARSEAYTRTVEADRINTDAEDSLWNTIQANMSLPAEQQRAASQKAFQAFLDQRALARRMRAAAAEYRAKHPLPEPPSQQCGGPLSTGPRAVLGAH
jgi:hypothetical protein